MGVVFDGEQAVPAADVLVVVGVETGVPAVSGELTIRGGHELLALLFVLADEEDVGRLVAVGVSRVVPPPVQEGVVAAELREVLVDATGAVVLDEECADDDVAIDAFENGVGSDQPGVAVV